MGYGDSVLEGTGGGGGVTHVIDYPPSREGKEIVLLASCYGDQL